MIKKLICFIWGHKITLSSVIKRGRKITVDKGICGIDRGTFISTKGFSCFGFYGTYKDQQNNTKVWDSSVHDVRPQKLTKKEVYLSEHCSRCGARLK